MTLSFPIGTSGETIHFSKPVIEHFAAHRQRRVWHREAGGQLFARIVGKEIIVEVATGPRPTDLRTRFSYAAKRADAQVEINVHHTAGLHYIGEWHSHPERRPSPSGQDKRTMESRVRESRHQLAGFIFVIVGLDRFPEGLTVVVHDGRNGHRLRPL